jgi:hypothetical protein
VKKTKKVKIFIPALLLLMLSAAAMPVIAIGPNQAVLDTPSGVHNVWSSTGYFNHWINASKGGGKMNNAVIVGLGPSADPNLGDILNNKAEYENTWIYFSKTVFRAFLKLSGATDSEAEAEASKYPDGIYWHFVYVG